MLEFESRFPDQPRDGAPLFVLLHGRGSDETDLIGLAPHLPDGSLVITPRAPHPGAQWGYGGGWAWYRYLGEDRPEPESFSTSLQGLEEFLDRIEEHLPVEPGVRVLGGFSQGGTTSLAMALRAPGEHPHIVDLSGFLPEHPEVEVTPETVAGTRFFWGHGTRDPAVSFRWAEEGRRRLEEAGADLTARDYPMGHMVSRQELMDLREWLEVSLPV